MDILEKNSQYYIVSRLLHLLLLFYNKVVINSTCFDF